MVFDPVVFGELALVGLGLYAFLAWLAGRYSRGVRWQPPRGSEHSNWALRRKVGFALGALAMLACALSCALWQIDDPARWLAVAQAALLAAAGSSDLQRFHLPLPLTLAGIALAVAGLITTPSPSYVLVTAALWVLLTLVLHRVMVRRTMQLGDYIATIWVALSAPVNGLLAVAAGDMANATLSVAKRLHGKKLALAGAWLIFAAALAGVPPYFTWFVHEPDNLWRIIIVAQLPAGAVNNDMVALRPDVGSGVSAGQQALEARRAAALLTLADWAGQHTASVALARDRAGRIVAAREAAEHVARLAALAQQVDPDSPVVDTLSQLAGALSAYDLAGVRAASEWLSAQRDSLRVMIERAAEPAPAGA
jgi:hypothetical protein